jgi:hypothetical protein
MAFCKKCGADIKAARYCAKCGFDSQAQTLIPENVSLDIGPRAGAITQTAMKNLWKAWWFIAIVVVVGMVIIFGLAIAMFGSFFKFFG